MISSVQSDEGKKSQILAPPLVLSHDKYFAFPISNSLCSCNRILAWSALNAFPACICCYEMEVQCAHTSSMSINCGTNGHFCSCLIHALGTECPTDIIIPISDPQLTFTSTKKQLGGWVWTSQADCKTGAHLPFLRQCELEQKKGFHTLPSKVSSFSQGFGTNWGVAEIWGNRERNSQFVRDDEANLKMCQNADLTD